MSSLPPGNSGGIFPRLDLFGDGDKQRRKKIKVLAVQEKHFNCVEVQIKREVRQVGAHLLLPKKFQS